MKFFVRFNVFFAVAETIATTVAMFLVYRRVLGVLGVDALGIWSIVFASVSLVRLGDLGIGTGINRALASSEVNDQEGADLLQTALLTVAAFYALLLLVGSIPMWLVVRASLPAVSIESGRSLFPAAALTLFFTNVSSVCSSAIAGIQRSYVKSIISISSNAVLIFGAYLLIPLFGLKGLAISQVVQSIYVLLLSYSYLFIRMSRLPAIPVFWSYLSLRPIISYSVKIQIGALAAIFLEPLVRLLVAHTGGVASVGSYEIAARLVSSVRNLIVSANQALLAPLARLHFTDLMEFERLVKVATAITAACAIFGYTGIYALLPLISQHALSVNIQPLRTYFIAVAIGGAFNTLMTPIYVRALASGRINGNLASHLMIAVLGPTFGWLGGHLFGPVGVMIGFSVALICGSLVLVGSYLIDLRQALRPIVTIAVSRAII